MTGKDRASVSGLWAAGSSGTAGEGGVTRASLLYACLALLLTMATVVAFMFFRLQGISGALRESRSTTSDYALRRDCSDRAYQFFKRNGWKEKSGIESTNFRSHWNSREATCFVEVTYNSLKSQFLMIDVYDAVEGGLYAEYSGHSICSSSILKDATCAFDSGSIWLDGDGFDRRSNADVHFGFRSADHGSGGNDNSREGFVRAVGALMSKQPALDGATR